MTHKPNMIKLAIQAAGGSKRVAAEFGISARGVSQWSESSTVPSRRITRLCELGENVIRPEQILTYIEQVAAEKAHA